MRIVEQAQVASKLQPSQDSRSANAKQTSTFHYLSALHATNLILPQYKLQWLSYSLQREAQHLPSLLPHAFL